MLLCIDGRHALLDGAPRISDDILISMVPINMLGKPLKYEGTSQIPDYLVCKFKRPA